MQKMEGDEECSMGRIRRDALVRRGQREICEATRDAGLVAGAGRGRSDLIFRSRGIQIGEESGVQGHDEVRQRAGELGLVRVGEREQNGRFVNWRGFEAITQHFVLYVDYALVGPDWLTFAGESVNSATRGYTFSQFS